MDEFDETMKDIKDNLIARIQRQEKEIEKWKWQKELLIKRDKEQQQKIEDLKEQVEYQDLWRKEYLSRIDKAREYITSRAKKAGVELMPRELELLEILDKENKENV